MEEAMSDNGKKNLGDLSDILFDQLERLNNPELTGEELEAELERSKAVSSVAGQVINNANTVIRGYELRQAMTEGGSVNAPRLLEC